MKMCLIVILRRHLPCLCTELLFLGRLLEVDLIQSVSNVRLPVRTSGPSVHKKFLWFQWHLVCR